MLEKNEVDPLYKSRKFQQTVSEISVFINEFFEEDANSIAEVVEFYFFLHDQDVASVIEDEDLSVTTRRYAAQFNKYLMNTSSELVSMLYDFATLFKGDKEYEDLVKDALAKIGYDGTSAFTKEQCLHPDDVKVQVLLNQQSPDISQGVDQETGEITD